MFRVRKESKERRDLPVSVHKARKVFRAPRAVKDRKELARKDRKDLRVLRER